MRLSVVAYFLDRSERFSEIVGQEASKSKKFNFYQDTTATWAVSNGRQYGVMYQFLCQRKERGTS
jgi:hypothetical protein